MVTFFIQVYYGLFTGYWITRDFNFARDAVGATMNKIASFLISAISGNYETIQEFSWAISINGAEQNAFVLLSTILAVLSVLMICFAVFGITKKIFSIFFVGVR